MSIIDDIIAQHFAASRALHAEARARREASQALQARPVAAPPAVIVLDGPLAPMSDYVESVRRGWSTD